MARPSDWDVIHLGGDPTPGVVESVQALAREFHGFADDAERAWRDLNSFGGDAAALAWVGQSGDAFKENFGPLPGRLQKLFTSYREAGDALEGYWPRLLAAQKKADAALVQGRDAAVALQRAAATATGAAADLQTVQQQAAAVPNPQAVTAAQAAHDTAQSNLTGAQNALAALTAAANQAHDDRIAAAKDCAKALHHAQSDGIHNKHWWEHVGEALSQIGGEIADIANEIAPVLDVLALATFWIPGVGEVTAALAEADNLIAMAGTGLKVAGDAMQGHWGDALMGAGMLGVQFVGGKLIEKYGGKALGALSAKFGKGAENSVGSEVRTAEGNAKGVCETDPVDVVSGWMLTDETDLTLPGVLPVVLRRSYASGYATGRLFGPGWASTLDQRISINDAGIHFAGDDTQRLDYPLPDGGEQTLPERGDRWPLVWDREADEIRITDPWSGQTRHFAAVHYRDEFGQIRDLTAISNRNGNRVTIVRDEVGTPLGIEHPAYRLTIDSVSTVAGPRVAGMRLLDGSEHGVTVKKYGYDDLGRLTGVVDSTGVPYRYEYDDADRIVAWIDRVGYRYSYEYDDASRVVRTGGDGGHMAGAFAYDAAARTTVFTNSLGDATTYRYDVHGHVVAVADPLGATVLTDHDRDGRLLSRVDALGNRTAYEHDESGNTVRGIRSDGGTVEAVFSDLHQIVALRFPDGGVWRREYDERGNLRSVTDPGGARTAHAHREDGAPRSVTDPLGATTRYGTDAAGLPTAIVDPLGAVTRLVRDPFGRVVSAADPAGAVTRWGWTVEGLPLWQADADGGLTRWVYDAEGRVLSTVDPSGAVTSYEPGPFGTTAARTDPAGVRHEFTHDSELRPIAVANAAGAVWSYTYDAAGRLVTETDFVGRAVAYDYDAAGRLTGRTTGVGQRVEFAYDAGGREARRRTAEGEFSYEYDQLGRLLRASGPGGGRLEYSRDAVGRVTAETVDGRRTAYEYDASGRRVRRITPAGAVSAWSFDAAGRAVALEAGTAGRLEFTRDAAGREVERLLGAGTRLRRGLDPSGRLSGLRMWAGDGTDDRDATLILSRDWEYGPDGAPTAVHDGRDGVRRFTADATGRVTAVHAATWTESYAYDAFGNVAAAETPVSRDTAGDRETDRTLVRRAGRTTYEHDAAGRLVRTVRRTLDGRRLVWEYSWDTEDRLVETAVPDGSTWHYGYDPLGRRTSKTRRDATGDVGERTVFVWDGPRLVEQHVHRSGADVATLTWDYEPGTFAPAAQRRRVRHAAGDAAAAPAVAADAGSTAEADRHLVDETFHAIVTDLVGTPTDLVTADGRIAWHTTTSLWGRTVATSAEPGVDCPLRFPGQYYDGETGLHYNLNRYYDPDSASYLTPDPLGLGPAPNDHAYVINPLTWVDPLGLKCTDTGLGYQKAGAKQWADNNSFTHYMKPEFIDSWSGYVRSDISNPNQTIHVLTEGFGPEGGFEGMATTGLKPGSEATQQEMGWLARSVIHGQRSWDSIKFYDKSGRIDVPEPKWYDPKWEKAWIFEGV